MLARISTPFDCKAEQLRDEISRAASWRFVAALLLHFESLVAGDLDGEWVVGRTYALRLSLFGFLPAGEHRWAFAHLFYRHRQRRWKVFLHTKIQGIK
jgi:hypothetical protein